MSRLIRTIKILGQSDEDLFNPHNPRSIYDYAAETYQRLPEYEHVVMQDPFYAYLYAKDVIVDRWPEAEKYIKQNPNLWDLYQKEFGL